MLVTEGLLQHYLRPRYFVFTNVVLFEEVVEIEVRNDVLEPLILFGELGDLLLVLCVGDLVEIVILFD